MPDLIFYVLLVLALAVAWYSGYRSKGGNTSLPWRKNEQDYFVGLNYLLNDEADQSIDSFIASLEVNSSTLESHLALGTLLRRRGKVDSSISVFQKLLADSGLDNASLNKVKLGLIKSYVAAGLLDRAERLIDELKIADVELRYAALLQGLIVYQLEKEWLKAIMIANELVNICSSTQRQSFQLKASHFYCELAEKEMALKHYNQAREYLGKANAKSRQNVRVSLLTGKLEIAQGQYQKAIKALLKIASQDAAFKAEGFNFLVQAFQASGQQAELDRYVEQCLQDAPTPVLLLSIVSYIEGSQGKAKARQMLLQQLAQRPSIELLGQAILLDAEADKQSSADLFSSTLDNFLKGKASYQCQNCGFELHQLHWLCPGCNEWGFIKPIVQQSESGML